jgi:hypothetical protein
MMGARWSGVLLLAGIVLCGCATPKTPDERLAADIAVCQRHAAEGPGGPSGAVGERNSGTLNPANVQKLSHLRPSQSLREGVYWDCLQQRGYSVRRDNHRLVHPDAIGAMESQTQLT